MTDEPKLYTQQEMDDVLEFKNGVIAEIERQFQQRVAELIVVMEERDAARELANQLAKAITVHGPAYAYDRVLDAYEERDWKPVISPPGSGLDGLQADIDRKDA